MKRLVQLESGRALVVTDLHGAWEPYRRYRDAFLTLLKNHRADTFILLGDVIHGYGAEEDDRSLEILLDLISLREKLGPDRVILLLGNHELPHIYNFTLAKGGLEFTARFEHRMGAHRDRIVALFESLPFFVAGRGGLLMHHAGVDAHSPLQQDQAQLLLNWDHDALIGEADSLINEASLPSFVHSTLGWDTQAYERLSLEKLAVSGPEDPRYTHLLRGLIITEANDSFKLLWDLYFPTAIENSLTVEAADALVRQFLSLYSPEIRARVLLTGHLPVNGGYAVVTDHLFRLASYSDARPREAACGLLIDMAKPIHRADELISSVIPLSKLP